MKRILGVVIVALLLGSCMTTRQLDESSTRPVKARTVRVAAIMPALPQVLNKEYLKAAIVAGVTYGGMTMLILSQQDDSLPIPGLEIPYYAGVIATAGGWGFSYFDGSLNANELWRQWGQLHPEDAAGPIRIGMTMHQFQNSMPRPTEVNRTVLDGVVSEQWVYRSSYGKTRYYYFDNGVLTAIQD